MANVLVDPHCVNHPDRLGPFHYGKTYEYSLCDECLDARLQASRREPLDEHGVRMAHADQSAAEGRQ